MYLQKEGDIIENKRVAHLKYSKIKNFRSVGAEVFNSLPVLRQIPWDFASLKFSGFSFWF